jgi:hypothetical protein
MPAPRWSIWIDIEGFSDRFQRGEKEEADAIRGLAQLMDAIHRVGSTVYAAAPDRLFAHQFGDGFLVLSDFAEPSAERPIALAISLMRHLMSHGVPCKSAIACGTFSDIVGCYPTTLTRALHAHHAIPMGEGLLTATPVMGTALIAPYKLSHQRKGAVLLVQATCFASLPKATIVTSDPPVVIDWIHTELDLCSRISATAGLNLPGPTAAELSLHQYISRWAADLDPAWVASTLAANNLPPASSSQDRPL